MIYSVVKADPRFRNGLVEYPILYLALSRKKGVTVVMIRTVKQ